MSTPSVASRLIRCRQKELKVNKCQGRICKTSSVIFCVISGEDWSRLEVTVAKSPIAFIREILMTWSAPFGWSMNSKHPGTQIGLRGVINRSEQRVSINSILY